MPVYVPLQSILLSNSIVEFLGIERTHYLMKMGFMVDPISKTFPLDRMNNILGCSLDQLPPISLQPFQNTDYYLILNGRHRVTYAILQEKPGIWAEIMKPLDG
jgi:hypothetical protein